MMKVKVVAFGPLTDRMPREQVVAISPPGSLADLLEQLELSGIRQHLKVAVNGTISSEEVLLAEGDEITLLPPSSGG